MYISGYAIGGIAMTFMTAFFGIVITMLRAEWKRFKVLKKAQAALTRDRIVRAHERLTVRMRVTHAELRAIEELYGAYADLGGNGYIEDLMKDIRALEIINTYQEGE